ncbi:MAG TPA: hypothetical protein VNN80_27715 [Polyangiaceae bacterium]|jgi:hypothetical protein|nr:hypothetical protein [Polyangiaceae bacterium]
MDHDWAGVAWHDAQLERVVRDGNDVRLEFSQVYVIRALGSGQYSEENVRLGAAIRPGPAPIVGKI